jgi:hypothetical protein
MNGRVILVTGVLLAVTACGGQSSPTPPTLTKAQAIAYAEKLGPTVAKEVITTDGAMPLPEDYVDLKQDNSAAESWVSDVEFGCYAHLQKIGFGGQRLEIMAQVCEDSAVRWATAHTP